MSERMHPADLRFLAATDISNALLSRGSSWDPGSVIEMADRLLEELAKSEPTLSDLCPRCQHIRAMGDPLPEVEQLRAELEQQKNHPGWMDRIRRERQEERERIIALLDCEADMPEGTPALLVRNVTSGETLNAAQLRAVLEP